MDEENIKGKMESSEAPALTVMDQEPVNTKVVNATVKANDLPSWLELLRDVMKVIHFNLNYKVIFCYTRKYLYMDVILFLGDFL